MIFHTIPGYKEAAKTNWSLFPWISGKGCIRYRNISWRRFSTQALSSIHPKPRMGQGMPRARPLILVRVNGEEILKGGRHHEDADKLLNMPFCKQETPDLCRRLVNQVKGLSAHRFSHFLGSLPVGIQDVAKGDGTGRATLERRKARD